MSPAPQTRQQPLRAMLAIRQQRILQALAEAQAPVSSIELRRRLQMFRPEFQSVSAGLRAREYIACELRGIRQQAFGEWVVKRVAFWFLTEKGLAYLQRTDSAICDVGC